MHCTKTLALLTILGLVSACGSIDIPDAPSDPQVDACSPGCISGIPTTCDDTGKEVLLEACTDGKICKEETGQCVAPPSSEGDATGDASAPEPQPDGSGPEPQPDTTEPADDTKEDKAEEGCTALSDFGSQKPPKNVPMG